MNKMMDERLSDLFVLMRISVDPYDLIVVDVYVSKFKKTKIWENT